MFTLLDNDDTNQNTTAGTRMRAHTHTHTRARTRYWSASGAFTPNHPSSNIWTNKLKCPRVTHAWALASRLIYYLTRLPARHIFNWVGSARHIFNWVGSAHFQLGRLGTVSTSPFIPSRTGFPDRGGRPPGKGGGAMFRQIDLIQNLIFDGAKFLADGYGRYIREGGLGGLPQKKIW